MTADDFTPDCQAFLLAGRRFLRRVELPVPRAQALAWHERPGAFERLNPPWDPVAIVARSGGIRDGARVTLRLGPAPFALRWTLAHRDYRPGEQFRDVQVRGPFALWDHTHRFIADGDGCILEDDLSWRAPLGRLGDLVAWPIMARKLEALFRYRHRVTRGDLAAHARHGAAPRLTVLLVDARAAGTPRGEADGRHRTLLQQLAAYLATAGHDVWTGPAAAEDGGACPGIAPAVPADIPAPLPPAPPGRFDARIGWQSAEMRPEAQAAAAADSLSLQVAGRRLRLRCGPVLVPRHRPLGRRRGGRALDRAESRCAGASWLALDDWLGAVESALHDDTLAGEVNLAAPGAAASWRRRWPVLRPALAHLLGRG